MRERKGKDWNEKGKDGRKYPRKKQKKNGTLRREERKKYDRTETSGERRRILKEKKTG